MPFISADCVTLIGKLGAAPEIKPLSTSSTLVLNLSTKIISYTVDEDGQRHSKEETGWHRIVSFNPRVIARSRGLQKEDDVVVRGYLERRVFEKDGEEREVLDIVAEELDLLSPNVGRDGSATTVRHVANDMDMGATREGR